MKRELRGRLTARAYHLASELLWRAVYSGDELNVEGLTEEEARQYEEVVKQIAIKLYNEYLKRSNDGEEREV